MKIKFLVTGFLLTSFCVFASVAFAEIYKCTGADGKVTFGDQPCANGQKAAAIKQQGSLGANAETASSATNSKKNPMNYKARPEYAECLKLRDKLAEFMSNPTLKKNPNIKGELTVGEFMGGEKQLAQARRDMTRYKEICGVVAKEGSRELAEKQEAEEKPRRDAEAAALCKMMRKEVTEQRESIAASRGPTSDQLTAQQAQAREKDIFEIEKRVQSNAEYIEKECSQK